MHISSKAKQRLFAFVFLFVSTLAMSAQSFVVKNNLLYDLTTTPNLSFELGVGRKTTFDLQLGLNPFKFADNSKFRHLLIQPEYRYWFCERFNGWFVGAHAHGGLFNAGNVHPPFNMLHTLRDHRYEGWFIGGGLAVGYQWVLSRRWSLEAELGAGYAYVEYDKFACQHCGTKVKSDDTNYWGVTKAAISLVYVLK